jgi:elongation factor 1-beta
MGEVFLKYRVMPEDTDVDLDDLQARLRAALPSFAKLERCEARPFAFGLKALIAALTVVDEEGNNDAVEAALGGLAGVQGVELLEMGRL